MCFYFLWNFFWVKVATRKFPTLFMHMFVDIYILLQQLLGSPPFFFGYDM
jgi:hypothetical protein